MDSLISKIDFSPDVSDDVEQCRRLFHVRGHAYPGYDPINILSGCRRWP